MVHTYEDPSWHKRVRMTRRGETSLFFPAVWACTRTDLITIDKFGAAHLTCKEEHESNVLIAARGKRILDEGANVGKKVDAKERRSKSALLELIQGTWHPQVHMIPILHCVVCGWMGSTLHKFKTATGDK